MLIIEAFLRFFDLPLSNVRIMKASTVIYTSVLVKSLEVKKKKHKKKNVPYTCSTSTMTYIM